MVAVFGWQHLLEKRAFGVSSLSWAFAPPKSPPRVAATLALAEKKEISLSVVVKDERREDWGEIIF